MLDKINSIPVINWIVPSNRTVSVERDSLGKVARYSVGADTEKYFQRQRVLKTFVAGPTVVYAGWKADVPWWQKAGIMSLGAICSLQSFYSWKASYDASKS